MPPKVIVAFLVIFIGSNPATAMGADEAAPSSVEELIRQLGSNKFADRERASRLLKERGLAALPALQKASHDPDREVQRRVQELIPAIKATAAFEPKSVSLEKELPLARVLQEIGKQTGYQVHVDKKNEKLLCADGMTKLPFWEAVERVRAQADVTVDLPALDDRPWWARLGKTGVRLNRIRDNSGWVSIDGAFRLETVRLHEDRDMDLAKPGRDNSWGERSQLLTITLGVRAEPKLVLLAIENPKVEVALDEEKKPLPPPRANPERDHLAEMRRFFMRHEDVAYEQTTEIVLRRSSEKAKKIALLRGSMMVQVVIEQAPVVVCDNLATLQGTKRKISNSLFEVLEFRQNGNESHLRIKLPRDQDHVDMRWPERIHLEDEKGNRYAAEESQHSSSNAVQEFGFTYRQRGNARMGPPKRLVVDDWTILRHELKFQFTDVPLP